LSREGASELSSLKPQLDQVDVGLVGVGPEFLGVEEFAKEGYFKGDLYVDESRQLYQAMKTTRASAFSLLRPAVWSSISKSKEKGFSGNLVGDGLQLGGTFVFDCESGRLLFAHYQDHFGDHANLDEVLQVVKDNFGPKEESQPE